MSMHYPPGTMYIRVSNMQNQVLEEGVNLAMPSGRHPLTLICSNVYVPGRFNGVQGQQFGFSE